MPFERFDMKHGPYAPRPACARSGYDKIHLNRTASAMLPANTHFNVWYDPDTGKIALEPAEECAPGALKLTRTPAGHASLSSVGIRKRFGIDYPRTYWLHTEPTGWVILTPIGEADE